MKVAVIGGGAAGFFSAISAKENYPNAEIVIFEKSNRVLGKVKVSGGGRCNVTHACESISELCKAYPRGGKFLKKAFHEFNNKHAMEWFEKRGVLLFVQEDGCVFPKSQDSQSIIDCFLNQVTRLKIQVKTDFEVISISQNSERFVLSFFDETQKNETFDKVIVTTGGSPKREGLNWLEKLNHNIEYPVPSLFSFQISNNPITELMGVVANDVSIRIQGTKIKTEGDLLITHWGLSGPAILKLSSFGARALFEMKYDAKIQVNWAKEENCDVVLKHLMDIVEEHPNKIISNTRPFDLPSRLWLFLLVKCEINSEKKWNEIGKKGLNKLMNILCNDEYELKGKTKFRDEYVTCGGISLKSVNVSTMESKHCKNLYFAGEVMDIDGITGGFNFQCAWTTGFIAGKLQ